MSSGTLEPSRMNARQLLALLALGAGACLVGYFLAHTLFAARLITALGAGSEEFARGVIGDEFLQLLCGAPFPIVVGIVVAGIAILVDHFIKMSSGLRMGAVLVVSFASGFIGYFPYQFLMLLASAF